MRKNEKNGQVEVEPFVAPKTIAKGSQEERFARHRAQFAKKTFDLDQENRRALLAAFKVWHRRQQDLVPKENSNALEGSIEN
jgi:hypothetical protein